MTQTSSPFCPPLPIPSCPVALQPLKVIGMLIKSAHFLSALASGNSRLRRGRLGCLLQMCFQQPGAGSVAQPEINQGPQMASGCLALLQPAASAIPHPQHPLPWPVPGSSQQIPNQLALAWVCYPAALGRPYQPLGTAPRACGASWAEALSVRWHSTQASAG